MGAMIEFARPDGGKTKGYLATAGEGRPGIVVIQEWWGLNDQICGVADRFARAGYNALAPEIYRYDVAHAFFNERSAAYDLASANQAWERMAGFLEKRR